MIGRSGRPALPPPTADELARWSLIKACGCILCGQPCHIHHLLVGNRVGHRYTIGLCPWHHTGECVGSPDKAKEERGPSLLHHKKEFMETYGTDQELLDAQDDLLGYERVVIPRTKERVRVALTKIFRPAT